jgi:outer membrane protein
MKRTVPILAALACLLAWPALLPAQSSDSAPERIAVINMSAAVGATQEGKQASAAIQKKYEPKQQDLQQMEKQVEQLQDQLQNQSSMLTSDQQYALSQKLSAEQRHLKETQEDDSDDYQADTQEAIRQIAEKMQKIITQYAQQHGYALVIGEQSIPVYYASKAVDITQAIVKLYDASYPVTAAANSEDKAPRHAANGDAPKH